MQHLCGALTAACAAATKTLRSGLAVHVTTTHNSDSTVPLILLLLLLLLLLHTR
jgi:4-amino-4-deoxy-L-arabinose transferase-like glycosyltransferase